MTAPSEQYRKFKEYGPITFCEASAAFAHSGLRICWARLSDFPEGFNSLTALFPECLRERVLRLRLQRDRTAWLLSKWLLAFCLGEHQNPEQIFRRMRYADSGSLLLDGLPSIHLSISHSGDIAVCAVSKACPVGVDIEQIRSIDIGEFCDIFHAGAWHAIMTSTAPIETFFEQWTVLEAVSKGAGTGLTGPVSTIHATGGGPVRYGDLEWDLHGLDLDPGYKCHLALARTC
jgi:4'-phosphopantetheinyl transferase